MGGSHKAVGASRPRALMAQWVTSAAPCCGYACGGILMGHLCGCYVSETQWHCNAHSNNVVVLSESEAARAEPRASALLCVS